MEIEMETVRVIAEVVGVPVFGAVGWVVRRVAGDLARLERNFAEYKLHVAENYVTVSSLEKAVEQFTRSNEAIMRQLERMDNKLDSKADRAHS